MRTLDTPSPELFEDIRTADATMLGLFRYVELVSGSGKPVLVTGETGVGKELFARAIHRCSGRSGRFVVVNVASLDDEVFSDTLFGHRKGAFTGAVTDRPGLVATAAGGTLFLDEIGDLTPASQAKLLRLIDYGDYLPLGTDQTANSRARIVAATNCDLWRLCKENRFRNDLNFRLRNHHLHVPALRERIDDVPMLVEHFIEEATIELERPAPVLTAQALDWLVSYEFPGNVRELRSIIYDLIWGFGTTELTVDMLQDQTLGAFSPLAPEPLHDEEPEEPRGVKFAGELPTLREMSELLIEEALRRSGGRQSEAARLLGVTQQAVSKRLRSMRNREAA